MPTRSDSARLVSSFTKNKPSRSSNPHNRAKTPPSHASPSRNPNNAAPALHDVQLTIAREQGFPSWPKFQSFIKQSQFDFQGQVAAFIDAATSDYRRAESPVLAQHPQIAHAGFYVALILGDRQKSRQPSPATLRSPKKKAARKITSRSCMFASPATPTRAMTSRARPP